MIEYKLKLSETQTLFLFSLAMFFGVTYSTEIGMVFVLEYKL